MSKIIAMFTEYHCTDCHKLIQRLRRNDPTRHLLERMSSEGRFVPRCISCARLKAWEGTHAHSGKICIERRDLLGG